MATIGSILSDIALRLPHSTATITDAVKIGWMNDLRDEIFKFAASTQEYMFQQTSGVSEYAMSTNMEFDMIKAVYVSDSTVDTSTAKYTLYPYVGPEDDLGNNYSKARGSTIGDILLPTPSTSGVFVKVIYESKLTTLTTSSSDIPQLNPSFQNIYKFRVMKNICQTGNNPDVELANNYQREEDAIMKKIKQDYYLRKSRKPTDTYKRSESWWSG